MTAPPGHVGIALLFATPAWFLWRDEDVLTFLKYVGLAVMLPDLDVYVSAVPHHGITHTVAFAVAVGLVGGAVAVGATRLTYRRSLGWAAPASDRTYVLAASGLALGGLSHVFLDVFSSSHQGLPLALMWPVSDVQFALDLVYYTDPVVNVGLVGAGLVVHLLVVYRRLSARRRVPTAVR